MLSAQDSGSSGALIPQNFLARPTGFVRLLVDSVQQEEALLDRLTLAIQDGSDSTVIVSIARELVEAGP